MPASDVLSGIYDILDPQQDSRDSPQADCPPLKDVLGTLRREHHEGYVYRGQTKEWAGPLLPSIYRGMVSRDVFHERRLEMRLREVGSVFHELLATSPAVHNPKKQAQMQVVRYLNQTFGYPLSQLLAQQCGLTSEGLDVTSDPDVGAFFATFDFASGQFVNAPGVGVIYRFAVPLAQHGVGNFKEYDYYTTPTYLNPDILKLFTPCDSTSEALDSLFAYAMQYARNQYDSMDPERPLELLRLPIGALEKARVVQQRSGLLIPDMILSTFYRGLAKSAPPGKAEKPGQNAIEDLAYRENAKKYFFRHSTDSKRYINAHVQRIFPAQDPFKDLLVMFLDRVIGQWIYITEVDTLINPERVDLLE